MIATARVVLLVASALTGWMAADMALNVHWAWAFAALVAPAIMASSTVLAVAGSDGWRVDADININSQRE